MSNDKVTPEGVPEPNDNVIPFPTPGANVGQDDDTGANEEIKVEGDIEPAFGVHVVMMPDGAFAIQATGEPNLGEMAMLLARAYDSIKARMVAETVVQVMKQAKDKSRIITPGR